MKKIKMITTYLTKFYYLNNLLHYYDNIWRYGKI